MSTCHISPSLGSETVDDAARDVRQSERMRQIDAQRFNAVLARLREKIQANDASGVVEAMKAVESVSCDLLRGWSQALQNSDGILKAFGQGEDLNA